VTKLVMHHGPSQELEKQRIDEMKNLSHQERMLRFFAVLELSYGFKNIAKIIRKK